MRLEARGALLALLLVAGGCGPKSSASIKPDTPSSAPSQTISTSTSVVSPDEALALEELLERADAALKEEDFEEAAADYRKAFEHATLDENRLRALFGWATALDLGAQPRAALRAYSRFAAEAPEGARRDEARVRVVRLLVYLERYAEAAQMGSRVDVSERPPLQQLALLAARAHEELRTGQLDAAERTISEGRSIVDAHGFDRVTVPPLDVASLFFALGELRANRAAAIDFDPLPADFAQALERRCRYLLDAQSAYSEVMRSQDAHWSSMAGVRVGQLYKALHDDLMAVPAPQTATTLEKKQLFEGAMRLRYSILLKKSLSMLEATVALLDRTPQPSRWREKAQNALREIRRDQQAEEAAIDALPYTREQLQQVLDEMASRAQSSPNGTAGPS